MRKFLLRRMRKAGWFKPAMDDTLRSRIAHGLKHMRAWYDWGSPAMWLVGRFDGGSAGAPRGRDLWWVPTEYVEGLSLNLVADLQVRYGCYVTTDYKVVSSTGSDIEWRIFDLQDGGHTVKIALWPHLPEHNGRLQPLPWGELIPATSLRLFLHWYLVDHKIKAQWLGLRTWVWRKGLHAVVHQRRPFSCQQVPPEDGHSHWHCELNKRHIGKHRYRNYVWGDDSRAEYSPAATV